MHVPPKYPLLILTNLRKDVNFQRAILGQTGRRESSPDSNLLTRLLAYSLTYRDLREGEAVSIFGKHRE
jgi:hypothetical protein